MLKTLLIAGALLLAPISAQAQECQYPFEATLHSFATAGAPWKVIPEDSLPTFVKAAEVVTGQDLEGVTRGFLVIAGGQVLLGLEVNDCLIPPIVVGSANELTKKLSGRGDDGSIGA
jgi:hypothetical protein